MHCFVFAFGLRIYALKNKGEILGVLGFSIYVVREIMTSNFALTLEYQFSVFWTNLDHFSLPRPKGSSWSEYFYFFGRLF